MHRRFAFVIVLCASLAAQEPGLESLRKEGHWKQIRARIEGWYQSKPQDPYALLWMSRVKQGFGELEAALDMARKAATLKPDDADIQAQLASAAGQSASRADGKLKQFSLAREMKKAGERALELKPDQEQAVGMMLGFYLQAPGIIGGGEGKARDLAERVGKLHPARGLILQANIALSRKEKAKAQGLLQQALGQDPKSYDAMVALAGTHLMDKPQELDKALAAYRQALALRPSGVSAHAQIAALLAEQGKWAELDVALAEARRQLPENLVAYYSAGTNLISEKKFLDRAEGLLRTYLTQPPEGNMPDHALAHWRLGQLKELMGKIPEAIAEFEGALRLRPGFKRAAEDLARLKKS